jgi:hypothetical protein
MHNQFDVTWLLRYCAGTYARFIAEGSNVLKTVDWEFRFWRQDRLSSHIVNLFEINNSFRPPGLRGSDFLSAKQNLFLAVEATRPYTELIQGVAVSQQ